MKKAKVYPKFYPGQLVKMKGPKGGEYLVENIIIGKEYIRYGLDNGEDTATAYASDIKPVNPKTTIGFYIECGTE